MLTKGRRPTASSPRRPKPRPATTLKASSPLSTSSPCSCRPTAFSVHQAGCPSGLLSRYLRRMDFEALAAIMRDELSELARKLVEPVAKEFVAANWRVSDEEWEEAVCSFLFRATDKATANLGLGEFERLIGREFVRVSNSSARIFKAARILVNPLIRPFRSRFVPIRRGIRRPDASDGRPPSRRGRGAFGGRRTLITGAH